VWEDESEDGVKGGNGVANFSRSKYTEDLKYEKWKPKEGYAGQVAIQVSFDFDEKVEYAPGKIVSYKKERSAVVFHELLENYKRTEDGTPRHYLKMDSYGSVIGIDSKKIGAHLFSAMAEIRFHMKSIAPGVSSVNRSSKRIPELCPAYN
jgi:hypothetical protein